MFLFLRPAGVWQGGVAAGAADVWWDRQGAVWRERLWGGDTPGAAGRMPAVDHTLSTSSVTYLLFILQLNAFVLFLKFTFSFSLCVCVFVCPSGSWGLSFCVPPTRASSGTPLQGQSVVPAAHQQIEKLLWTAKAKRKGLQSKFWKHRPTGLLTDWRISGTLSSQR